jgi:hypothetical protein
MNTEHMTTEEIIKYLENGTIESMDAETILRLLEYTASEWYERGKEYND